METFKNTKDMLVMTHPRTLLMLLATSMTALAGSAFALESVGQGSSVATDLSGLGQKLGDIEQTLATEANGIHSRLTTQENRATVLTNKADDIEKQRKALETRLDTLDTRVKALRDRIGEQRTWLNQIQYCSNRAQFYVKKDNTCYGTLVEIKRASKNLAGYQTTHNKVGQRWETPLDLRTIVPEGASEVEVTFHFSGGWPVLKKFTVDLGDMKTAKSSTVNTNYRKRGAFHGDDRCHFSYSFVPSTKTLKHGFDNWDILGTVTKITVTWAEVKIKVDK